MVNIFKGEVMDFWDIALLISILFVWMSLLGSAYILGKAAGYNEMWNDYLKDRDLDSTKMHFMDSDNVQ